MSECPHIIGMSTCEVCLEEENAKQADRIAELEARIAEAVEVFAGMEGFIPQTAPEAYTLRIIDDMIKALAAQEQDK